MITKQSHTLLALIFALTLINPFAAAQEVTYSTDEDFFESGYNYYWSVIQAECDRRSFYTPEQAAQFHELMDIMVRTGTGYGHTYDVIDLGITQMYPRLLKVDPDPPLYAQYRHIGAVFARGVTPEKGIQLGKEMLDIAARMKGENYPPLFEGVAWIRAAHILSSVGLGQEDYTEEAFETGMDLVIRSASLEGIPPESREYIAYKISKLASTSVSLDLIEKEEFCYRLFDDPETDPWIAHTSMGLFMIKKAWAARTAEFAFKVNDARWDMFRQYLRIADTHLTQAWSIRPEWPYASGQMIKVAMGSQLHPDRDEYFWFNEVMEVRANKNEAFYFLAYALTPKWGGSIDELRTLLDDISQRAESTPDLGHAYFYTLSQLAKSSSDRLDVLRDPDNLEPMSRFARELWFETPGYSNIQGIQRVMRVTACAHFMQGNYEEAQYFLKNGGGRAYRRHKTWKEPFRFSRWMHELAIDDSGDIIRALEASDQGDLETALEFLRSYKARLEEDPDKDYPEVIIARPLRSVEQVIRHIELHGRDN